MKYSKISLFIPDSNPPYFIGSQIRGAFGYALKKVVCINPSYKCEECFAKKDCLYYEAYELKNSYHPYRFDFELGKKHYDFSIYLFEHFAQKLPYFLSALHKMVSQIGFTKDRIKYKNFELYLNDLSCYKNAEIKIEKEFIKSIEKDTFCPNISIRFVTQLRLKKRNRLIGGKDLELYDIVNSIYQRSLKLCGKSFERLPFDPKGEIVMRRLDFIDLNRYSNRQNTMMKFGGIIGEIKIDNLDVKSYNILKKGEIIGVGKQTVFGLGKIVVEKLNE